MREWQSQAHVRWYCRYHIVIVPKYRRKSMLEFPPFRGRFRAWDSSRALRWWRAQYWTYPPLVVDG